MAAEAAVEAIFGAVREGDTEAIARMLDVDPQLLSSTKGGDTLLIWAAERGHAGIVRLLLEWGTDVNTTSSGGTSALHLAAFYGHEEAVSTLLSSGADVYRRSAAGDTALMHASQNGHVAVVRLLLQSMEGCGLNEREIIGRTALYWACCKGHADIVRVLLLAGADHTIADEDDTTPQQVAQDSGHQECAALIQVSPFYNHTQHIPCKYVRCVIASPSQSTPLFMNRGSCLSSMMHCINGSYTYASLCRLGIKSDVYSTCVLQWWEGELARADTQKDPI
jgi:ankyrin repeat protein